MDNTQEQSVRTQVHTASGINIVAGLWLIIAPFVLGYSGMSGALWNDVVLGIGVAVLAIVRVGNPLQYEGISWTNFVLGLWLIIAPFVIGYTDTAGLWNDIILGVIILSMAAWSAMSSRNVRPSQDNPPR